MGNHIHMHELLARPVWHCLELQAQQACSPPSPTLHALCSRRRACAERFELPWQAHEIVQDIYVTAQPFTIANGLL